MQVVRAGVVDERLAGEFAPAPVDDAGAEVLLVEKNLEPRDEFVLVHELRLCGAGFRSGIDGRAGLRGGRRLGGGGWRRNRGRVRARRRGRLRLCNRLLRGGGEDL